MSYGNPLADDCAGIAIHALCMPSVVLSIVCSNCFSQPRQLRNTIFNLCMTCPVHRADRVWAGVHLPKLPAILCLPIGPDSAASLHLPV